MSRLSEYFAQVAEADRSTATIAFLAGLDHLDSQAPEVAGPIEQELRDQRSHLKLIASENYCSPSVLLAMGNWLTDKYAEGYPHHRFYGGCQNVDSLEELAAGTLKELFQADHAFVQPHSGADANLIAFWSILIQRVQSREVERLGKKKLDELTPDEIETLRKTVMGQKLMGMSLNAGGHLTHGFIHNLSSKMFQAVSYDVDPKTEQLDYAALAEQAKREKPLILLAGYSAYPRALNFAKLREIAHSVGAVLMVDMAHFAGLVAGKVLTGDYDPVPHAHLVTSTTHKTLRGPRGGFVLCREEFKETVNKACPLVMGGPLPHMIAAKAVAFKEASQPAFRQYAQKVVDNARTLAETLMTLGVRVTTGGTDNHLLIADVSSFGLNGRQAEQALSEACLTVNRNTVPFDKKGAWYTSGIRLGTPALTTLGMGQEEMKQVAQLIFRVLSHTQAAQGEGSGPANKAKYHLDPQVAAMCQREVGELLIRHPLYPELPLNSMSMAMRDTSK